MLINDPLLIEEKRDLLQMEQDRLLDGKIFADLSFEKQVQYSYFVKDISSLNFKYFELTKTKDNLQDKAIKAFLLVFFACHDKARELIGIRAALVRDSKLTFFGKILENLININVEEIFFKALSGFILSNDVNEIAEGYYLLKYVAIKGHSQAQTIMAYIAHHLNKDMLWSTISAQRGCAMAQSILSLDYLDNNDGETHYKWCSLAAQQGCSQALNNLGNIYQGMRRDLFVEVDYIKATNYYLLAAAQGNRMGLSNCGKMHEQGLGTVQDDRKAAQFYRLSHEGGYMNAQVSLQNGRSIYHQYHFAMSKQNDTEIARLMSLHAELIPVFFDFDFKRRFECENLQNLVERVLMTIKMEFQELNDVCNIHMCLVLEDEVNLSAPDDTYYALQDQLLSQINLLKVNKTQIEPMLHLLISRWFWITSQYKNKLIFDQSALCVLLLLTQAKKMGHVFENATLFVQAALILVKCIYGNRCGISCSSVTQSEIELLCQNMINNQMPSFEEMNLLFQKTLIRYEPDSLCVDDVSEHNKGMFLTAMVNDQWLEQERARILTLSERENESTILNIVSTRNHQALLSRGGFFAFVSNYIWPVNTENSENQSLLP